MTWVVTETMAAILSRISNRSLASGGAIRFAGAYYKQYVKRLIGDNGTVGWAKSTVAVGNRKSNRVLTAAGPERRQRAGPCFSLEQIRGVGIECFLAGLDKCVHPTSVR